MAPASLSAGLADVRPFSWGPTALSRVPNRLAEILRCGSFSWAALGLAGVLMGCGPSPSNSSSPTNNPSGAAAAGDGLLIVSNRAGAKGTGNLPMYSYEIVNVWPHDRKAFTQGLVFLDGELLESTGLNGQSSLRRVQLESGIVAQQISLPYEYFGEGIAVFGRKIFQLTWQNNKAFVYDLQSFRKESEFTYHDEGWGLTTDDRQLIMSDGTDRLRFLNPDTFEIIRTVNVTVSGRPLSLLNELEYIKGEIFANVYQTDFVARIDPGTGHVRGVIDFSGLLPATGRDPLADVLNGIAYDRNGDRIFVTGKRWPKLFEVRIKPK